MANWTSEQLTKIGNAEELQIASLRRDGTLRKPVTIWVVRLGDDLYVRCVNGRSGAWFRGTRSRLEGNIRAGGVDKMVAFIDEVDPAINDQLDNAYYTKYNRRYPSSVKSINSPEARTATIKLVPKPEIS